MNSDNLLLVICLTVVIVIGVNGALIAVLRRGNEAGQVELFRRAMGRARNPWHKEDDDLKELARMVAGLKSGGAKDEEPHD